MNFERALLVFCIVFSFTITAYLGFFCPTAEATTYHTITIDGDMKDWAIDENIASQPTGVNLYFTWDASYLYVGWKGTDFSAENMGADLFLYFDTTAGGTTNSLDWYSVHTLPFEADYAFCIEASSYYGLKGYSSGTWNDVQTYGMDSS